MNLDFDEIVLCLSKINLDFSKSKKKKKNSEDLIKTFTAWEYKIKTNVP